MPIGSTLFYFFWNLFVFASSNSISTRELKNCTEFESKQIDMEDCLQYDILLHDDLSTDNFIGEDLYDERVDPRVYALKIKYPANWNTSKIAVFNDAFLTPRPWWMVIAEKYEWDSASESSLRLIRMLQMDKQFMAMAAVQYPTNCEDHMYTLRCTGGFNEYGAEYGNIESMYIAYSGSIVDETVGSNAHWVHDNYCPNTLNKFRCAFLPPHNCTVKEFPCSRPIMCFDKATVDAKSVDDFISILPPLHLEDISSQLVIFYLHESQNYNTFVRKVKKINISPSLYYIGLLFRQNYDYRSRVAQFVNEFRKSNHFYSNQSCIAFHIRRGD